MSSYKIIIDQQISYSLKQDGNKLNIYSHKQCYDSDGKSEKKGEAEPLIQFIFNTPFKYIISKDEFTPKVHYIEINSEELKST